MLTTRKRNALLLASIVIAAAALFVAFGRSTSTTTASTMDAIPADAFLVATFDIAALRDSPIAAPLAPLVSSLGASEVEAQCGFEPVARVQELSVAIPEGQDGEFGILARGKFSRDEMSKCASAVISARGGSPAESKSGDFSEVSDDSSTLSTPSKIAWDDHGLVLVGRGAWLGEMIEASHGVRARIATNAQHTELRSALGKGRLGIVTATLPAGLRKKIERQMQSDSEGENAMMQGVLGVAAAGLAVGTIGTNTEIALELRCDNADACAQVEKLIAKKKSDWSQNLGLRLFVGPLLDGLTVNVDGAALHASSRMPTDDAKRLIERAVELRSGGGHSQQLDAGANPTTALPRTDQADEIFSARSAVQSARDAGAQPEPKAQLKPQRASNPPTNTPKSTPDSGGP
jgi:hypothetical protein